MQIVDLKTMPYRDAWAMQEQIHAEVVAGAEERILVVEHPPVITFGRRAGIEANLLASADELARRGVEVVQSDRGGDITFHGPGQVVVYPIVRLIDHHLSVGSYVRVLELAMIAMLARFGIRAGKDACAIGVWVRPDPTAPAAKIGAVGVRVRQGVTLHGLALNVTTDLTHFSLINPCGLTGRPVMSMRQLLGDQTPAFETVKKLIANDLIRLLNVAPDQRPEAPVVGEGRQHCPTE